jgi:hypothetical protein
MRTPNPQPQARIEPVRDLRQLLASSRMLKKLCKGCHSERREESRSGNKGRARFLARLGITGDRFSASCWEAHTETRQLSVRDRELVGVEATRPQLKVIS